MAKLGKRDGLKHHCPKGLAGSNPAPGTLRGRADRRVRGPSGPAAERPGAGSTAATARRRTPEGEYDVTYPRPLDLGFLPRDPARRAGFRDQNMEEVPADYPARWISDVVLSDGGTMHVRPILPTDGPGIE